MFAKSNVRKIKTAVCQSFCKLAYSGSFIPMIFISILLLHISPTAPLYPLAAAGSGEWKQLPL